MLPVGGQLRAPSMRHPQQPLVGAVISKDGCEAKS